MRTVHVIGIGTGDPHHLTLAAIEALRGVDILLLLDKGEVTEDMRELRRNLITTHCGAASERPEAAASGWSAARLPREVVVPDPKRDEALAATDYARAVADWHEERARRIGAVLEAETTPEGAAAILIWGDPSLYDSTLRILERVRAGGTEFRVSVVPGIMAPSALAAAFGLCLNRVGEPIHITTGRRLASTSAEDLRNVVVMLDAHCTFREVAGPGAHIWWGAYLGSDQQILLSGPVATVAEEIVTARARARAEHGWIMDTYLLRDTAEAV